MAGRWTATGEHLPGPGTFGITCTGGAIGKCVRYGYKPWGEDAEGRPLWDLHQTCVRLVRADYCGDGVSWTETGTLIDLYDRRGIQAPGAVCVRHTRLPAVIDLEGVLRHCPAKLQGRTGAACTEDPLADWGEVLLRNKS